MKVKENRKNKLNSTVAILLITFISCCFFVPTKILSANDYGLDDTADRAFNGSGNGTIPFKDKGPPEIIGSIVGAILSFVGLLFFILIIYGGLTWMTAAGNQQQIDKAKSMIVSAVIGLIIVMAAYALTSFVGTALS
jgi:cbb3-type cytochrome oxidase subunit 3